METNNKIPHQEVKTIVKYDTSQFIGDVILQNTEDEKVYNLVTTPHHVVTAIVFCVDI